MHYSKILCNFALFSSKVVKNKVLDKYKIDIFKLENKLHTFEFEGGNEFFAELEQELVEKGQFKATITLDKSETMIQMKYHIVGNVELTCDRSLELFDFPIDTVEKLILKFGDHNEELSDELYLIDRNTQQLNIAHDLFEFIGLEIPMKKLHPRFLGDVDEDDDFEDEEGILVYSTGGDEEDEPADDEPIDEDSIDPRWAALKNLKK